MFSYSYRRADCFPNRRGLGAAPPVTNGLLNNLKAYWSFNLGGSLSGIPDFGPVTLSATAPATSTGLGKISNAIICSVWGDSVGGYFPIGDLTPFVFSQNVSISVWLAPNTNSGSNNYGTAYRVSNLDSECLCLAFENNVIRYGGFANFGNNTVSYSPPSGWTADTWIHVVQTLNASTGIIKLYVNGSFVADNTSSPSPAYSTADGYEVYALSDFTSSPLSWGSFGGKMDEFGIWQKLLTATDVSNLYNSGAGLDSTAFQT